MQEVTDLGFWRVVAEYGPPDLLVTEYFRVHSDSRPERQILRAIRENPCGVPVLAQLIGGDVPALVRTAGLLQRERIAGIDLNLGCPAPLVCKKDAGGGLLRRPEHIDLILGALRASVATSLTVKTRVGFDRPDEFGTVLDILCRHRLDAVSVHARTVREMYAPVAHYDWIRTAATRLRCPVIANGNISSVAAARAVIAATGARGLMIGRGAVRNPWIFRQIRDAWSGATSPAPTLVDVRQYIDRLYHVACDPAAPERARLGRLKKLLAFILPGLDPSGELVARTRSAADEKELFRACDDFLTSTQPFDLEPHQDSPCTALV
ncbi:MAG TPA: tRNA-dihydrouridine synthase family protein [Verrucomicrobiae bacterium]|nr:tRNA-dihydrouridine synthase family protein [Verrucomicrobiae bacterium]